MSDTFTIRVRFFPSGKSSDAIDMRGVFHANSWPEAHKRSQEIMDHLEQLDADLISVTRED